MILLVPIWVLRLRPRLDAKRVSSLFFIYLFFQAETFDFSPVNSAPVHYSQLPQTLLFSNFFIKNGSHDTIHTFKNYFATVFFSFQFSAVFKRTLKNNWSNNYKDITLFFSISFLL